MANSIVGRAIEILLVEDNPADVRLTVEGFKEARIATNLSVVMDGKKALDFLYRRGEYSDAPRPDVILLDLNLPGVDGRSILKEIKNDQVLKVIPVVVLTSSEAETDIVRAYESYANSFVSKPIDFEGFMSVVHSIENFWFTVVKLP
uniref:response regulator n=1 Tax=Pararhizobium sp. IMCC3301 TaxID=3067904 RepID=UPI0027420F70|nr:response regulator [Pararhizobium sp. IMCC3301]